MDGLTDQVVQGVEADDRVHRPGGQRQAGRRPVEPHVDVRVVAQGLVRQVEADHEARRWPLILEPGPAPDVEDEPGAREPLPERRRLLGVEDEP